MRLLLDPVRPRGLCVPPGRPVSCLLVVQGVSGAQGLDMLPSVASALRGPVSSWAEHGGLGAPRGALMA